MRTPGHQQVAKAQPEGVAWLASGLANAHRSRGPEAQDSRESRCLLRCIGPGAKRKVVVLTVSIKPQGDIREATPVAARQRMAEFTQHGVSGAVGGHRCAQAV